MIFGGSSNEHEVSVVSASSIIKNLDKEKYHITPIYLNKNDEFYLWKKDIKEIEPLTIGVLPEKIEKIDNAFLYLKQFDLIFLMIHGKNGEDGKLSSILDFMKIPYIGNKTASSVVTMDKILTKDILEKNGIKTSPYLSFMKYNQEYLYRDQSIDKKKIYSIVEEKLSYPLFVKPANSGSSIGVKRASNTKELIKAIDEAFIIDHRILIEQGIDGKEVECGILEENDEIIASVVGEVCSAEDFYSFSAKYTNPGSHVVIPADISKEDELKIREQAKKVFKVLDCHGFSRCDFFLTKDGEVLLNEINTIPGFTEISMYPKLFCAYGINYPDLLDILIGNALNCKK